MKSSGFKKKRNDDDDQERSRKEKKERQREVDDAEALKEINEFKRKGFEETFSDQ